MKGTTMRRKFKRSRHRKTRRVRNVRRTRAYKQRGG